MDSLTACCPVIFIPRPESSWLQVNTKCSTCSSLTDKMLLNIFKEVKEAHENHNM